MAGVTRRDLFRILGVQAASLYAQMATRNAKPVPRGKFSGLPFHAKFTDVARQAGLTGVSISGHADHNDYIVESLSGGCAFLDYDNDGWLDVLVLSSSR